MRSSFVFWFIFLLLGEMLVVNACAPFWAILFLEYHIMVRLNYDVRVFHAV
jgi:hypothetical protein